LCRRPIAAEYFAIRDKTLCPACCDVVKSPPKGKAAGRFFKALAMGLGAGLLGAIIWFAIRKATGYEIGLVAVAVGFMVGKAVRKGSGGRGGRVYQVMAVILTYSCIASNYMPDVFQAIVDHRPAHTSGAGAAQNGGPPKGKWFSNIKQKPLPVQIAVALLALVALVVLVFLASAAAPFLVAVHSPIQLFIIGIALWEAWKFTTKVVLPITGPYQIGSVDPRTGGPRRIPMVRA
jgi:hypothetical protein